MAAFSYQQHHPFLIDSDNFFQSNPIIKNMSASTDETNNNINSIVINNSSSSSSNCFSQFFPPEILLHDQHQTQTATLEQYNSSNSKVALSDNEPSLTQKQSTDSSIVVDKLESGEQVTQKVTSMGKKRKNANGSSLTNCAQSKDGREVKSKRQKKCNVSGEVKEDEKKPKTEKKDQKKVNEEPPTGFIHVRARRGQATDSHSLAERVRREKISERMKILQRLVPGCDKVTGKALMLDEIINYVQSLQNQVEFLSMKLASVNPLFYDFGMDLDAAYMIRPERLNSMASPPPLPPVQQCSPTRLPAFAEPNTSSTTTTTTTNFVTANDHYNLMDGSSSVLLQGQRPNEFSQDSGSLLWEMEEQRQRLLNPSGFTNLCSFP